MKILTYCMMPALFAVLCLHSLTGGAQTFEEYKKQRQQDFQQFKENETRKMQALRDEYDAFVRAREQEYEQYLKQAWEAFEVSKAIPVPEEPKPLVIPEFVPPAFTPEPEPMEEPVETPVEEPVEEPAEEPEEEPVRPPIPPEAPRPDIKPVSETLLPPAPLPLERLPDHLFRLPELPAAIPEAEDQPIARLTPLLSKIDPSSYLKANLNFDFYGTKIYLDYDQSLSIPAPEPVNEDGISRYWKEACQASYHQLINQLLQYRSALGLNDWGYCLLVKETAERISPPTANARRLLTWFLLTRSGYKAKISYAGEQTSVIIPTAQVMYGKSYVTISHMNYYFLDKIDNNEIHTYARDYHDATRLFDFNLNKALNLAPDPEEHEFTFTWAGRTFKVTVPVNKNVINFYRDYPQVDLNVYFDAAVEPVISESVGNELLPMLEPLSEAEKVNFLLKFVQTAFGYQVDQEQFGREKYFFAEEVFYYPYSDCEDRSVLFAWLVHRLLGMKVIGLSYDGHVATAVHFDNPEGIYGKYFVFRQERYIVTDPTYINAPAGMTMPQYASAQAELLELAGVNYNGNAKIDYWELAAKAGGYRGGNQKDLYTDDNGNVFLTGYYLEAFDGGEAPVTGNAETRNLFTAKYNRYGALQWVAVPKGPAVSTGFAITADEQQNLLVAGSFSGQIYLGGYTLNSREGQPDVFIAKYDPAGVLVWAGQAGLDTIDQDSYLKYLAKFDRNGKHLGTELYLEDVEYSGTGLYADEEGTTYLAGNLSGTTGFRVKEKVMMDGGEVDYPSLIKKECDRLIAMNFERNIAAVFAVTSIIRSNGMVIPGSAAQQALDRYQPGFRKEFPELYAMLGKIIILKNGDGIITLLTKNQETIYYDKLKILNGTQVKISPLQDGNERIDILSGIKVGKMVIWFTLNYIQLDRTSGNLLFDYDSSHMQLDLNLAKDIMGQ